jgi:hypothetical protein
MNGPVFMLFFISKKGFISENNNIAEEIFPCFTSFPQENENFLKKLAARFL